MKRAVGIIAMAAAIALAAAGCAGGDAAGTGDRRIAVVASTNVYAQIAQAIGGDAVDATAIISKASQDPHEFEPSARDQLTVSRADLIIENGGGYDAFMDQLVEASGTTAPVLTAVEFSHDWPGGSAHDDSEDGDGHDHGHVDGFNEHVWYDPATMGELAAGIASQLEVLSPDDAATFTANVETFRAGIADLENRLADIDAAHAVAPVFVTEPAPLPLVDAAGLHDVTPPAFSEAVEEGQDVAPATLLEAMRLLESGDVQVVIANAQTGGAETTQIIEEAQTRGIPVLEFTETLPADTTYLEWMAQNIDALRSALQ
ncbi:MAG TPA: zinc ABC transporter substrate-binding protein [Microbacterium sp.]|nr:zinc ABC transporter substrate-binding protein [Microbacterium sp.]